MNGLIVTSWCSKQSSYPSELSSLSSFTVSQFSSVRRSMCSLWLNEKPFLKCTKQRHKWTFNFCAVWITDTGVLVYWQIVLLTLLDHGLDHCSDWKALVPFWNRQSTIIFHELLILNYSVGVKKKTISHPSKPLFEDASPIFPAVARSQRRRGANGSGFGSVAPE